MNRTMPSPAANPLERSARSVPVQVANRVLIGTKIAGALALIAISIDQSYDGTRAFTLAVAIIVLATLASVQGLPGALVTATGAGLLLFAGSTLTFYGMGLIALACGLVAVLAALVLAVHRGTTGWALAAIFAGAPLTAIVAVLVIAATER